MATVNNYTSGKKEGDEENNNNGNGGIVTATVNNNNIVSSYNNNNNEEEEEEEERRKWKASPYAVGYVGASDWNEDDITICCCKNKNKKKTRRKQHNYCSKYLSSLLCSNAGRIGHMVVLYDGIKSKVMLGPYWPIMIFVTYPLIFGVSLAVLILRIPHVGMAVCIVWSILTITLIVALAFTSCRNPGILLRVRTSEELNGDAWIWNDQALTYRPRNAKYDRDCACVIEEFDHTCPWTGTAIGKNNMPAFRIFTSLVLVCFVFDLVLFVTVRP